MEVFCAVVLLVSTLCLWVELVKLARIVFKLIDEREEKHDDQ